MRGYLLLARIGNVLPLEVLIDVTNLYESARDSAHKANSDFLVKSPGIDDWVTPLGSFITGDSAGVVL